MSSILLALGNFHRWLDSDFNTERMASTIERILNRALIDGFEVGYSADDLTSPGDSLPERFQCLPPALQARIVANLKSIHLPSLGYLNRHEKSHLAHSVRHAYETGLCSEFTIHPDKTSFEDWKTFLKQLPKEAIISVENMDKDKQNYRTLGELIYLLDSLPQLHVTFDICHWLELGHQSDSGDLLQFLGDYGERISKIHFSAPRSHAAWYNVTQGMQDNHNLVANSGWNISEAFFKAVKNVPFVMEGGIPIGCVEGIVSEVELIRRNVGLDLAVKERLIRAA